jgi:hypothetical protein
MHLPRRAATLRSSFVLFSEQCFPCLPRLAVSLGGGDRRIADGGASMIVSQSISANSQNRAVTNFVISPPSPRVSCIFFIGKLGVGYSSPVGWRGGAPIALCAPQKARLFLGQVQVGVG